MLHRCYHHSLGRLSMLALVLFFGLIGQAQALRVVYVPNSGDSNVSAFSIDAAGALTAVPGSPFAAGSQPYEVTVSPNGAFAYVANLGSGTVSAYTVSATGALTPVAGSPFTTGSGSSSVAVSPNGAYAYVANRFASTISAFTIDGTGALTPVAGSPFASASPISLQVSPNGGFVYVANTGGAVSAFAIGGTGALTPVAGSPFAGGSAPWAIAVSPNGALAYTANLAGGNVSAYTIGGTGALTAVAGSPFAAGTSTYAVTVSPNGAYAYAANAGSNNVSGYTISGTGVLTPMAGSPFATGAGAFSVKVSPDGAFAYVAHTNANNVSAYAISGTGALTPVAGSPFTTGIGPRSLAIAALPGAPATATVAASSITGTGATLNGTVSANDASTTVNFDYGLTTGYGAAGSPATAAQSPLVSTATGLAVSAAITGLTCNTTYHYRVNANNGIGGTINGSDLTFSTLNCAPSAPVIGAAVAGNAQATVTFTAPVSNGGSAITGYTVVSSPAGGVDTNAGTTGLSHVITGLTNGTPYTFTVTATNAIGIGAASAATNSITPAAPAVAAPSPAEPPAPTVSPLPVGIGGVSLPTVFNLTGGSGPALLNNIVTLVSNALNTPLTFVEQTASGTVVLSGLNGGKLAFVPLSYQGSDGRINGIYPLGNGQFALVSNGTSVVIAPAVVNLAQLAALLPGVTARLNDNGNISALVNGVIYVVQPDFAVQLRQATGTAQLVTDSDGTLRFIDAGGNSQLLAAAFLEPFTVRSILQGLNGTSSLVIQQNGTAAIVYNGQAYVLVPDLTLGGIPAERLGQSWWQEGPTRFRVVNTLLFPGTSQGFSLK